MRILYFAPVPWASYPQRPHFMVRFLVERRGARVLWVNPYPTRLPRWTDRRRPRPRAAEQSVVHALPVATLDVPALPVEPLPGGPWVNRGMLWRGVRRALDAFAAEGPAIVGVGRPSMLARWALTRWPAADSFYDRMDEFPSFYTGLSRWRATRVEAAVARAAQRVLVSSEGLARSLPPTRGPVVLVPNACDMAGLPPPVPAPQGPPVAGYVGTIARWFDWPVVLRLAESLPEVAIRLVGPCYEPPPRRLPPNVSLRAACSREAAVEEMRQFWAGLIPFRDTTLTRGVDPIKYYEYRALGLPVLTTRFGTMAGRAREPAVHVVDERTEWASAWAAVTERPAPEDVSQFRRDHDWSRRFDEVFPAAAGGRAQPLVADATGAPAHW